MSIGYHVRRSVFYKHGPNDTPPYYRFNTQTGQLILASGEKVAASNVGQFKENMNRTTFPTFSPPTTTLK